MVCSQEQVDAQSLLTTMHNLRGKTNTRRGQFFHIALDKKCVIYNESS